MRLPPALNPGNRVRVVAPSGPFDRTLVYRGVGWLSSRYRVEYDRGLFERQGFLAGSDSRRLAELNEALEDPGTVAIVAARGGYGLSRIAHLASLVRLVESPKWLVGFSDFTALHAEAWRIGVCSLHAHNVAGLGRSDARARSEWIDALEAPSRTRTLDGLSRWHGGQARGPLVGGNLTVLGACALAGRLRIPPGAVLFIEDTSEAPYRLDRVLTTMLLSGALDPVAACVVGQLTDCEPGRHGVGAEQAVRERLAELRIPIVAGVPAGHGQRNVPLVFGAETTVDANAGRVTFGRSAG